MKVDLGIWGRLARIIVFLLVAATLVGVALWYLPLIQANERWQRMVLDRENELRREEETTERLRAQIESFNCPRTIERAVRERWNYARPGELVVRFEDPVTNSVSLSRPSR